MLTAVAWTVAAEPPAAPDRGDVERVLAAAPRESLDETALRPLCIVLWADRKDHGQNEHDYPRWQARWSLLLGGTSASSEAAANLYGPDLYGPDLADPDVRAGAAKVEVQRAWNWPEPEQWARADLMVVYAYVPWTPERREQVSAFLQRGGGLVLIHSATWIRPEPSPEIAELTGVGGFRLWRHGPLDLELTASKHPILAGLPPRLRWVDEPYWPPTPTADGAQVLATSREKIARGAEETASQPQFWTYAVGRGRVFGCVPGHYTWTFDDPYFRLLLLRGMAWAAGESPYRFDPLVLRCARVNEASIE